MLASKIPLSPADTKSQSPTCWGAKEMTEKKELAPPKACRYMSWNRTPDVLDVDWRLSPKWAPNFPEVRHLLRTVIAEVPWPKKQSHSFSTFSLSAKLTQTLVTDAALAQYLLLTFNRHLLYLVVTLTAGDQCLWLNTSNRNLRCGYLSGGRNIWRMCFSDIYIPLEMKGVFCMTHIHVFHLWYF